MSFSFSAGTLYFTVLLILMVLCMTKAVKSVATIHNLILTKLEYAATISLLGICIPSDPTVSTLDPAILLSA